MPWQSATLQIEHGISTCVCSVLLTRRQSGRFAQYLAPNTWRLSRSAVESLGSQVGMRRERIRQNAYRCVDIAARNRQNQLRPSSPFWPIVTRRMPRITSDIAISSAAERNRSVIWTATSQLGGGSKLGGDSGAKQSSPPQLPLAEPASETNEAVALLVLGVDVNDVNGIGELIGHLHSPLTAGPQVPIYIADQVAA
jgi:hypothetical protein